MTSKPDPFSEGVPHNFLGLSAADSDPASARVAVLPVPYDGTVTYRPGARFGPAAIVAASRQVELFDEETGTEPCQLGIATLPEMEVAAGDPAAMVEEVARIAGMLLDRGKFVVTLGGEHTVALGSFIAHHNRHPELGVLYLDAHGDLRNEYQGSPFSHACVARRMWERAPVTHVGLRSMTAEGLEFLRRRDAAPVRAADVAAGADWIPAVMKRLPDKVYLSVDLDVLDPSVMPAVGTPEPGGIGWYDLLALIRTVAAGKEIVGVDLVELAPLPGNPAPDFLAARLLYKIIAYLAPHLSSAETA